MKLLPKLRTSGEGAPEDVVQGTGPEIFNNMSWASDVDWSEARLKQMLV